MAMLVITRGYIGPLNPMKTAEQNFRQSHTGIQRVHRLGKIAPLAPVDQIWGYPAW